VTQVSKSTTASGDVYDITMRANDRLTMMQIAENGTVIKENHDLIVSGAYGLVRHPIYSGILCALVGTAVALDHWRAVVGIALVVIGLARKIHVEEQMLIDRFGESYLAYKGRVPALIPCLPR